MLVVPVVLVVLVVPVVLVAPVVLVVAAVFSKSCRTFEAAASAISFLPPWLHAAAGAAPSTSGTDAAIDPATSCSMR